jgi:hypothetical protein
VDGRSAWSATRSGGSLRERLEIENQVEPS